MLPEPFIKGLRYMVYIWCVKKIDQNTIVLYILGIIWPKEIQTFFNNLVGSLCLL